MQLREKHYSYGRNNSLGAEAKYFNYQKFTQKYSKY